MVAFFVPRTKTAGIIRVSAPPLNTRIALTLAMPGVFARGRIAFLGLQTVLKGSAHFGALLGGGLLPAFLQGSAFFTAQLGHPVQGRGKDAVQFMGSRRQGQKGEQQGEKRGADHVESPLADLHLRESR